VILPSFASSPKIASNSVPVSFVRIRSSVHSALPFKEASAHSSLSYGFCLGFIEGEQWIDSTMAKMFAGQGETVLFSPMLASSLESLS
jgi:hypothetical protein